jgi:hypothetical protein
LSTLRSGVMYAAACSGKLTVAAASERVGDRLGMLA